MTFDRFRLIGWAVPGLCLLASFGVVVNRHAAFSAIVREDGKATQDLQRAHEEAEAVMHQPKERRFACAPAKPDEETEFLMDLRQRAKACGVSIARWSAHSSVYEKKPGDKVEPKDKIVEGVTKVSCDLALDGSYPALRAFLASVWTADRLLTVSHVDWNRTEKDSELSMSLGRYIAPKKEAKP